LKVNKKKKMHFWSKFFGVFGAYLFQEKGVEADPSKLAAMAE